MFEPVLIGLFFLLLGTIPSNFEEHQKCTRWSANCEACGKTNLSWKVHLFCANFASSVGGWARCCQAWCPSYYISNSSQAFHVYQSEAEGGMDNEDADRMGNEWHIDPGEANKFHQARMGDHLMVAFEYDSCVFHKLYRREPIVTDEDAISVAIASDLFQERNGFYPSLLAREHEGRFSGPAICYTEGIQWTTAMANGILYELLAQLFDQDPALFPSHIVSHGVILAKYHVYRSFRQASDLRAISKEVALADIRVVNR
jgi:hypothetical protein